MADESEPNKPRVLVVEDNEIIVADLVEILEESGCAAVGKCSTMQDALAFLDMQSVDVAIVDYHLADG